MLGRFAGNAHARIAFGIALALIALPGLEVASAEQVQIGPQALPQIQALLAEKAARTGAQQKISSALLYASKMQRGKPIANGVQRLRTRVQVETDGTTLVDIKADVNETVLAQVEALGATIVNNFPQYHAIRARIPLDQVEALALLPQVISIRPADEMITHSHDLNAVNVSQGDVAHRAAQARTTFGVDGNGITIGVLSDGVNSLAARQATGDLPANVTVLPGQAGSGDEGTAMLEIVHDLAPGANLLFATAFSGQAAFAANIVALRNAGANVIVDDVFYFAEHTFQDGIIAQAVETVTAAGAVYFSSAGNSGNLNDGTSGVWEGDFSPTAGPPVLGPGVIVHNFGGGQNSNQITSNTGPVTLKWSDATGASANDYDLCVLDSTLTVVLECSTDSQTGTQDPFEIIGPSFANERLVIIQFSGAARFLHLNTNRGRLALATAGQTSGHAAAANAFGVAAVNVATAGGGPFTGGAANPVETFSSDGPRRIFYEANGTPITPGNFSSTGGVLRQKPDIAAADGVATATPGFNPFFGTSAAAPHAAAIAALVLDTNPTLTPAQVRTALTSTALDIEAPGVDRDSGGGILDALAAVGSVAPPVISLTADRTVPQVVGAPITFTATATGSGPYELKWLLTTDNWNTSSLLRDWGGNTFTWTSLAANPAYQVGVWIRLTGTSGDPPLASAAMSFPITPPTVTLSADKPSPQVVRTPTTFTATATGGGAYQYKWLLTTDNWNTSILLRDWGGNTFTWTPLAANPAYQVGVWVRVTGDSSDVPQASAALPFPITPPTVTLSADKPSPQVVGIPITFTATATGPGPYEFKWLLTTDNWNTSSLLRDWGGNTFTWIPTQANPNYQVGVWLRIAGVASGAPLATTAMPFALISPPGPAADKPAPQVIRTTITFTAAAPGGGVYQYKWWLTTDNWKTWSLLRDWGGNTFAWTPTVANPNYQVGVWVRPSGSTTDAPEVTGALPFAIAPPTATLRADRIAPQIVGAPMTFTATATGPGPYEFRFWLHNGTTWGVLREWGANTFTWTPLAANPAYQVGVWVRLQGTPGDPPVASAAMSFPITPTTLTLNADKVAPQPVGASITFAATVTGSPPASFEFRFWLFDGSVWNPLTGWQTSNTFPWTPTAANRNYQVGVWVRVMGDPRDAPQATAAMPFRIGLEITSLTCNPPSPQNAGTSITCTVSAAGGTVPIQFKWFLTADNWRTWSILQDWGGNTVTWMPSVGGSYQIGVWARSNGNFVDAAENNAIASIPFAITQQSQVRFLNDTCFAPNCTPYTARLRAEEGYTWDSFSGVFSPYQTVTSPTLSNFQVEAVGIGPLGPFPGTFNLVSGRRYLIRLTVSGGPVLLLYDEGVATGAALEALGVPEASISGRQEGGPPVRLAPAPRTPGGLYQRPTLPRPLTPRRP